MKSVPVEVLKNLQLGHTDEEVAKLTDLPIDKIAAIRADCVKNRLLKRNTAPPVLDQEARRQRRKEIAEFIDAGNTYDDAKEKFGATASMISRAVAEFSQADRGQGRRRKVAQLSHEDVMRIAVLFLNGKSDAEIARQSSISREWARKLRDAAVSAGLIEKKPKQ